MREPALGLPKTGERHEEEVEYGGERGAIRSLSTSANPSEGRVVVLTMLLHGAVGVNELLLVLVAVVVT